MKWPRAHYLRVIKIINAKGLSEDQFSFIKRKGWVHMIYKPSEYDFSYFHKKETRINDETHAWEESSYFQIKKIPGGADTAVDQKMLFDKFEEWVAGLNI